MLFFIKYMNVKNETLFLVFYIYYSKPYLSNYFSIFLLNYFIKIIVFGSYSFFKTFILLFLGFAYPFFLSPYPIINTLLRQFSYTILSIMLLVIILIHFLQKYHVYSLIVSLAFYFLISPREASI
jgi:hypothetical protein